MDVRVATYNIRSLRDDFDAVVRIVGELGPDVLCVQEMPRFLCWWWKRPRLARACGLDIVAGRRAAGLSVLAAPGLRVVHDESHLLSPVPGLHRRGVAWAVLERGGERLIAASTHLDLRADARLTHTRELLALLGRARDRHRAPVVLGGDINEESGAPSWTLLTGAFQDAHAVAPTGEAHTFPSRHPHRRIDGVFADPGVGVRGAGVPDVPGYALASDHRPVLAELAF